MPAVPLNEPQSQALLKVFQDFHSFGEDIALCMIMHSRSHT